MEQYPTTFWQIFFIFAKHNEPNPKGYNIFVNENYQL